MFENVENFFHNNLSDFNSSYVSNSHSLKIFQWNVRGINNLSKFDEILQIIDRMRTEIDIIVIGESLLKHENCALYEIPNYKAVFSCREDSSGGLAVYVCKNLESKVIKNIHVNGFHHIHIELNQKGASHNCGTPEFN